MIKINLNSELDYEIYEGFHNLSVAGADFGAGIKEDHPDINLGNHKDYIDRYYQSHQSELLEKQQLINAALIKKQTAFFPLVKELFGMDFNHNSYQGYLSTFNCNPRYPETKTFQIFYKKDLAHMLEVTFHETLHFCFFDYLDLHLAQETKGMDKNTGVLWEMSEVFNILILNLPPFRDIIEMEETLFYSDLKPKLDKAQKIWNSCKNVKQFVIRYLAEVK